MNCYNNQLVKCIQPDLCGHIEKCIWRTGMIEDQGKGCGDPDCKDPECKYGESNG